MGLIGLLCTVGAFWLLSPTPMPGPDTQASTWNKMGTTAIDARGSDQNGKHLLGSRPGSEDAHENALNDMVMEEEAMGMDGLVEELVSENKDELEDVTKVEESESCEYKTPHKGIGIGVTTRPTPVGLNPG